MSNGNLSAATARPSSWVVRHAATIRAGGRVLDLACGAGRHARFLAARGFAVVAVDHDAAAVAALLEVPGVAARHAELEGDVWPLAGEAFDGVVVTRYLHRPRLPELAALLAPGGVLIYETFMRGNEVYGSPRRADFLLETGELRRFVAAQGLELLDFREGFEAGAPPAVTQSICARRAGA